MEKVGLRTPKLSYHTNEAVKTLRTNLLFCREETKVVAITSSVASEGKSNIAIMLCKALADIDKKVLLIDADIRRSVLATKLVSDHEIHGLSHFLSGQATVTDILYGTNIKNLNLIVAGPSATNVTELLTGPKFEKLIEACKKVYDYIIIDAAPVGLVVDAAIISEKSDGAIYVVESGKIKHKFAHDSIEKIKASGCPILGVVLNKVDHRKDSKYYGKYYTKYYGKYEKGEA